MIADHGRPVDDEEPGRGIRHERKLQLDRGDLAPLVIDVDLVMGPLVD